MLVVLGCLERSFLIDSFRLIFHLFWLISEFQLILAPFLYKSHNDNFNGIMPKITKILFLLPSSGKKGNCRVRKDVENLEIKVACAVKGFNATKVHNITNSSFNLTTNYCYCILDSSTKTHGSWNLSWMHQSKNEINEKIITDELIVC